MIEMPRRDSTRRPSAGAWVCTATAAILLWPAAAAACPVCFSGVSEKVLETYYFTAVGMTLLPLIFVGVLGMWLRRQFKRAAQVPTVAAVDHPSPS